MNNLVSSLQKALPIVAAAYGEQFGVSVRLSGSDAYTDGKTIVVPMIDSYELKDVLFGYLTHEAAHIRFTDFTVCESFMSNVEKSCTNILEDIRIERLFEDLFPGTKLTLNACWDYIIERQMSPPSLPEDNEATQLLQYLLHRLNFQYLNREASAELAEQSLAVIEKTFPKGFLVKLNGLLANYIDKLSSTSDCLALSRAILKALKESEQREQSGDSEPPASSEHSANDAPDESSEASSSPLHEKLLDESDLPLDAFEQLKGDLSQQAQTDNSDKDFNIDVVGTAGSEFMKSGDTANLESGVLASCVLRSRLIGLLQSKSRDHFSLHTKGRKVDVKRLAQAGVGEQRVFLKRTVIQKTSASVHLLLDSSYSMDNIQGIANQATASLALAVSAIPNCDIAVSAFPGDKVVSPIIKRGLPVRANLARFDVSSDGGTPLAQAMLFAARELCQSKHERKVLIIVTDGEPNAGEAVRYLNDTFSNHIHTYAIGICSTSVRKYFKNWTVINNVKELQNALFDIAKQFLDMN